MTDCPDLEDAVHVYPDYGPDHDVDVENARCWCSPRIDTVREDDEPDGRIVGHVIIHRDVN